MANNIREIITQAVIAKGKKRTLNKYPFSIEGYDPINYEFNSGRQGFVSLFIIFVLCN